MSNILLADADVWTYQFAFRNTKSFQWDEGDEVSTIIQPEVAKMELGGFIDDLREKLHGDEVYLILSDTESNFRKSLAPFYKSNRKAPKPELWSHLREYIEHGDHGFPVRQRPRLEGDDVLGIMATHPKMGPKSIVVTIDKDLQTVPCRVYFHNKPDDGIRHIDRYDAQRFHIHQVLIGDTVDGYKGIPGVGPMKASKMMDEVPNNEDLWEAVVSMYADYGLTEDDALLQARLAYILQHGDYTKGGKIKLWKPSRLKN